MNRLARIILTAIGVTVLVAAPCFAEFDYCVGEGHKYPNLNISRDDTAPEGYPVRCMKIQEEIAPGQYEYVTFYAKTSADCAQAGSITADPDQCDPDPTPTTSTNDKETDLTIMGPTTTPGTTGTTTKKDDEANIILIISLIANGIFFIAIIVLLIMLSKKSKALAVDETIIASTQVIYPHNSQKPYTPNTPNQPNHPNNHF